MKPGDLLGKLAVQLAAAAIEAAVEAVGKLVTRPARPPDPRIKMPDGSLIYADEHCWTRYGTHLPPQECIWCKQKRTTASRYCPGVSRKP